MAAKIIPFRKRPKPTKPEAPYCADRVIAGEQDPDLGKPSKTKPDNDQ